jgi:hypothetical protein
LTVTAAVAGMLAAWVTWLRPRGLGSPQRLVAAGSHDLSWDAREPVRSRWCLPGEDGGDVLGGHAMQVQVYLLRELDRGRRLRERLSGPRHSVERVQGSVERGPGAGRVLMCAAPAPCEQAHQADGTSARDDSYHDQEDVNRLAAGRVRVAAVGGVAARAYS